MEQDKETVLPKGTVVKVDGLPFELLEGTPAYGLRADGEAAQDGPATQINNQS